MCDFFVGANSVVPKGKESPKVFISQPNHLQRHPIGKKYYQKGNQVTSLFCIVVRKIRARYRRDLLSEGGKCALVSLTPAGNLLSRLVETSAGGSG